MNKNVVPESSLDVEQRGAPAPAIVWLPGTALLCTGPWMVTDGGLSLGWAFCAVGLAMVIIGAVAQGVTWGMDIHKEATPDDEVLLTSQQRSRSTAVHSAAKGGRRLGGAWMRS